MLLFLLFLLNLVFGRFVCTFLYLFSHDFNTHIRYLLGEDTHTLLARSAGGYTRKGLLHRKKIQYHLLDCYSS